MSARLSPAIVTGAGDAAALFAELAAGPEERAAVLYLDPEWRVLGRSTFTGSPESVAPPLRAIVAEALRLGAATLVLGHNHPSGSPGPSASDLAFTRALVRVGQALDLVVADHLILAGGRVTSLRAMGLM